MSLNITQQTNAVLGSLLLRYENHTQPPRSLRLRRSCRRTSFAHGHKGGRAAQQRLLRGRPPRYGSADRFGGASCNGRRARKKAYLCVLEICLTAIATLQRPMLVEVFQRSELFHFSGGHTPPFLRVAHYRGFLRLVSLSTRNEIRPTPPRLTLNRCQGWHCGGVN